MSRRRFSFGAFALHRCRRRSRSLPGSRRYKRARDGFDSRVYLVDAGLEPSISEARKCGLSCYRTRPSGYGYTAKPRNGNYTIEGQGRLLIRLLDALSIPRAIIVGSSYGGAVAATCALDFADRVERGTFVGAA